MKRLFLLAATVALFATSCEKQEIRNEVIKEIGFTSNVEKQTKAIITGEDYNTQPFGVYAYGPAVTGDATNMMMENVEISKQTEGWKAATGKYYWPNNPNTKLSFYAYSPAMTSYVSCVKDKGITLADYVHSDNYLDFMVATPVANATYETPNGTAAPNGVGVVPVIFNHQMTQLKFKFMEHSNTGITYTVNTITLDNVYDQADYDWNASANWTDFKYSNGTGSSVNVFPVGTQVATGITAKAADATEAATLLTTTGITVIPQTIPASAKITINYTISGTGVATETVTKEVLLSKASVTLPTWAKNQVVVYNITFSMREILFAPSVEEWATETDGGNLKVEA